MASQFGYLNYSPCRLEAEMKATSEINAEVRQALGLKPGESLVQGAKDAKTKPTSSRRRTQSVMSCRRSCAQPKTTSSACV